MSTTPIITKQDALDYHRQRPAGKLAIAPTKPMQTPRDLALAYSPGVAEPCLAIAANVRVHGQGQPSSRYFQWLGSAGPGQPGS